MSRLLLIFEVAGQGVSYLSELLLDKGNTVHGIKRRSSSFKTGRINQINIQPRQSDADLNYIDLKLVVGRIRATVAAVGTRSGRSGACT
ncbi:GDP-mannose 4,6-dehydratase [Micromonospora sp. NIE79]|uniref:GDP-mannose 4,6-dehydratase n=1 Tax=Micromonospora trifolii TaxID=2911208 RepID=A0ABS9N4W2_9ACTN|nr:GDP-mannose 4,6-dehydratase [Micromonospora trifolii]MCG5444977.1 GDP-mannose 4,6-dehydratase [Micromonospora trifolii]